MLACPIASAAEASPIAFAAVEETEVSAGFALPVVGDFTAAVVSDGSPELLQGIFLAQRAHLASYPSHIMFHLFLFTEALLRCVHSNTAMARNESTKLHDAFALSELSPPNRLIKS